MQTIIHGDAKDANMLFVDHQEQPEETHAGVPSEEGGEGKAETGPGRTDPKLVCQLYDFQYIGKAPPTKDLAYAFACASNVPAAEEALLQHYHSGGDVSDRVVELMGATGEWRRRHCYSPITQVGM